MEQLNDIVGKNLKIYQNDDYFKFSLESVLLPNFVKINLRDKNIIDLCSGNCPIPLILSLKTKANIYAVELQKEVYELGNKSIKINKKEEQITLINDDICNLKKKFLPDTFDIVTVNPPYFKMLEKSLTNQNEIKKVARHESNLTLDKLFSIAFYLLKTNGSFYMVHRNERLIEIYIKNQIRKIIKVLKDKTERQKEPRQLLNIDKIKNIINYNQINDEAFGENNQLIKISNRNDIKNNELNDVEDTDF